MSYNQNLASPINKTSNTERIDTGPYVGIVKGYGDPTGRGRIAVYIPDLQTSRLSSDIGPNKEERAENTILCNLMLPFYGRTNRTGNNSESYSGTTKSYGMWFPTPDIDSQVLVVFADGRKTNGFVIGGVTDPYATHMMPGLSASTSFHETAETKALKLRPGSDHVPVAEFNRQTIKSQEDWMNIPRPVHPLFTKLLEQGLAQDEERGFTSASSVRESPSNVFGISTPGPLDTTGPQITQGLVSSGQGYESYKWPASRLQGHSFVMDDGAETGGSQHVRLRSGSGHQILLNDSAEVIYIGNSTGKAWIEFTNDGRIEIYGDSEMAVHAKGNLNFLSDKNINIQAGEDINIISGHDFKLETNPTNVTGKGDMHVYINGDIKTQTTGDTNIKSNNLINVSAANDISLTTLQSIFIKSAGTASNPIFLNTESGPQAVAPNHVPTYTSPATVFDSKIGTWKIDDENQYLTATTRNPVHEPDPRQRTENINISPGHLR